MFCSLSSGTHYVHTFITNQQSLLKPRTEIGQEISPQRLFHPENIIRTVLLSFPIITSPFQTTDHHHPLNYHRSTLLPGAIPDEELHISQGLLSTYTHWVIISNDRPSQHHRRIHTHKRVTNPSQSAVATTTRAAEATRHFARVLCSPVYNVLCSAPSHPIRSSSAVH